MTTPPTDGSRRIGGSGSGTSTSGTSTSGTSTSGTSTSGTSTSGDAYQRTEEVVHPEPSVRPAPVPTSNGTGVETRPTRPAKTSAAAVFALVFGLAALFCALTALLSPVAVVFGIIGLVLAFVGLKMAKRPGVTGKGVAIGGLVTALLGLVLGGVIIGGAAAVVNDKGQLDRVQSYLDKARAKLPSSDEVRTNLPGQ